MADKETKIYENGKVEVQNRLTMYTINKPNGAEVTMHSGDHCTIFKPVEVRTGDVAHLQSTDMKKSGHVVTVQGRDANGSGMNTRDGNYASVEASPDPVMALGSSLVDVVRKNHPQSPYKQIERHTANLYAAGVTCGKAGVVFTQEDIVNLAKANLGALVDAGNTSRKK